MSAHVSALRDCLAEVEKHSSRIAAWGAELAQRMAAGRRLLTVGNGGSAAQAQHLSAELVGRYREERAALSALALHAETSSLTAIVNDYGPDEAFARQVRAHGRPGDVLLALSTSGRSTNLLAAVAAARELEVTTWALTGAAPNPLADDCDDCICLPAETTATVQELHLVVLHMLCEAVDRELAPIGTALDGRSEARIG